MMHSIGSSASLTRISFRPASSAGLNQLFPGLPESWEIVDIVPIDGKAIKGFKGKGKRAAHMVSAWSSKSGLVLGQKKVDKKSSEITA